MPATTPKTFAQLDDFTRAYIVAALWSSTGPDDEPLDKNYGPDDLAPETLERMIIDCENFQNGNAPQLEQAEYSRRPGSNMEYAGHDFWLTRCGHGSGFWDGDLPDDLGNALTFAANAFGNCDLYPGDDGKLYLS